MLKLQPTPGVRPLNNAEHDSGPTETITVALDEAINNNREIRTIVAGASVRLVIHVEVKLVARMDVLDESEEVVGLLVGVLWIVEIGVRSWWICVADVESVLQSEENKERRCQQTCFK